MTMLTSFRRNVRIIGVIGLLCTLAMAVITVACVSEDATEPPTPEPTAIVPATAEPAVVSEADLQATVQAMMAATVAAVPAYFNPRA